MHANQKADGNVAWGAEAIGQDLRPPKSAEQVRYLFRIGAFGDAVKKLGHRTLVGDRSKLAHFPFPPPDQAA
jgi:hypothetical protein